MMFTGRSREISEDYFGWSISFVDGRYYALSKRYEMLASDDLDQLKAKIRQIETQNAMYRNLYEKVYV